MNCICPVLGNTPLKSAFIGEASEEQYLKTIPLGRFAEPTGKLNFPLPIWRAAADMLRHW